MSAPRGDDKRVDCVDLDGSAMGNTAGLSAPPLNGTSMQRHGPRPDARQLLPKVLIVGGADVDARLDLMRGLAEDHLVAAAGSNPRLAPVFAQAGFRYLDYPLVRGVGPCSDGYACATLWRLMRWYRPDIVHTFDTKPGVYGCLAACFAGVPVVVVTITGLGSLYDAEATGLPIVRCIYERLQRMAARHADLIIFQNGRDRAEFIARRIVPAGKAALIAGSGVATDIFNPSRIADAQRRQVRAALGIPGDDLLVTLVARVIRSKGIEEFVAAARTIRRQRPGTHFLLVGAADRDSRDSFRADELAELGRVVNWAGARRDIPQVLAASDLFVLPSSLREGIPRVLLEAAAMALPIITTDTPGCSDVVEDGVRTLLEQPELRRRFGQASRRRAMELFDLAVVVQQTRRHYRELLACKTSIAYQPEA
jgi:glycosyltransferase involved in cell wall biosynthesis